MSIENVKSYDDLLLEAKEAKHGDIWTYYHTLVEANAQGGDTSKNPQKEKHIQDKHNKRSIKVAKGQTLTSEEEADADWFDALNDWTDDNHDVADNACDVVEMMTDKAAVTSYDVVNTPAWTTFTP